MLDFLGRLYGRAREIILNPLEKGIWWLTIGVTAALLLKLWLSGLVKIYRLLFSYLAVDFLSSVVALFVSFRSPVYGNYYFSAQTLKILIAAFILVEIYSLALERHPALARFGRSAVGYFLLGAALIPALSLLLDHRASAGLHPYLNAFLLFEQTMDGTMAFFLIILSAFLAWFPVRMRRNVIVYIGGFIAWTLSRSILVYVVHHWFNKNLNQAGNIAQQCVVLACLLFWLVELRREGEARTAVVGHLWNRAEAERLTEQLEAINESLERMRRKQAS